MRSVRNVRTRAPRTGVRRMRLRMRAPRAGMPRGMRHTGSPGEPWRWTMLHLPPTAALHVPLPAAVIRLPAPAATIHLPPRTAVIGSLPPTPPPPSPPPAAVISSPSACSATRTGIRR